MIESDELLSIRAAELYYEEDKTQDEIGSILALTRWKVGRLLAQAKASGFVRIEIVHPRARRLPLERRLRETCGLTDAIVVSSARRRGPGRAAGAHRAGRRRLPGHAASRAAHARHQLGAHAGRRLPAPRRTAGRAASTSCRSTAASA